MLVGLRILVAPLDWGLGHATRCIPIIRHLQMLGAVPVLAGEGPSLSILTNEFPQLEVLTLPGYRVQFAQNPSWFLATLSLRIPGWILQTRREHAWLQQMVTRHRIDGIISDNRPGLYHQQIPSVFITHQPGIETGFRILNPLVSSWHRKLIERFSACWIPDYPGEPNLAGKLSHPETMPKLPLHYLGPLTRMLLQDDNKTIPLLVLISGPEPQRTIWEEALLNWLPKLPLHSVIVRGKPETGNTEPRIMQQVTCYDHVPAHELNRMICAAEKIIARAGYSTIMDLAALRKPAILVPTPGQGEQEYLAKHLHARWGFYGMAQSRLQEMSWKEIETLSEPSTKRLPVNEGMMEKVLEAWLEKIAQNYPR